MSSSSMWRRRSANGVAIIFAALSAITGYAQTKPEGKAVDLTYRSVFATYQGFAEQTVSPWQQTNDAVARAGGWRAYAREAQQPEAQTKTEDKPVTAEQDSRSGGKP